MAMARKTAVSETGGKAPRKAMSRKAVADMTGGKAPRKKLKKLPALATKTPVALNGGGKPRKKYRYKPGTVALREIKKYQKSLDPAIPFTPFARLVREVSMIYKADLRFQSSAIEALREVAKDYLVTRLQAANVACFHGKRITIMQKDMKLTEEIVRIMSSFATGMIARAVDGR